jgi:hydrogenase maturation protein HypF
MWQALLGDLVLGMPVGVIAARFHRGLAAAIARMVGRLTTAGEERVIATVVLTGGVFQNAVLHRLVATALEADGYCVLTHAKIPCNDGGLSLGQSTIAAARALAGEAAEPCA